MPLNRIAVLALKEDVPSLDDRLFRRWTPDLHFHDLRHTFATRYKILV